MNLTVRHPVFKVLQLHNHLLSTVYYLAEPLHLPEVPAGATGHLWKALVPVPA